MSILDAIMKIFGGGETSKAVKPPPLSKAEIRAIAEKAARETARGAVHIERTHIIERECDRDR